MDKIIDRLETEGYIDINQLPSDLTLFFGQCSVREISLENWNKITVI